MIFFPENPLTIVGTFLVTRSPCPNCPFWTEHPQTPSRNRPHPLSPRPLSLQRRFCCMTCHMRSTCARAGQRERVSKTWRTSLRPQVYKTPLTSPARQWHAAGPAATKYILIPCIKRVSCFKCCRHERTLHIADIKTQQRSPSTAKLTFPRVSNSDHKSLRRASHFKCLQTHWAAEVRIEFFPLQLGLRLAKIFKLRNDGRYMQQSAQSMMHHKTFKQ